MKANLLFLIPLFIINFATAQVKTDLKGFMANGATATQKGQLLEITWPADPSRTGKIVFDLAPAQPLFKSISLGQQLITAGIDPAFVVTVGKRDLLSQNGWNIFFDKVPNRPYQSYPLTIKKTAAAVRTEGSRTIVSVGPIAVESFNGMLEITFYNGSPLFNVAAILSTEDDAKAIVFDAGMSSKTPDWKQISWMNTGDSLIQTSTDPTAEARNQAVKYRAIVASGNKGALAIFPPPHQYFYPLDEAFNLQFTWFGKGYRQLVDGYGIGIRQELQGDKRFVPWFNAPPTTKQRLNFFCLLSVDTDAEALTAVKKFTNNDRYQQLPGFKTLSSHFHNEFVMKVMMAGQPVPEKPEFVQVFKDLGVDIVHLAEFHYTADPKGPDEKRLPQLKALFDLCEKQSDDSFLLLPGEEPNEFFGGHWLDFFPRPVYWVMSRKPGQPYVEDKPGYGKVYHIGNKEEMLQLLKDEKGLAWTAHPRTKGSVNTPDIYNHEDFFQSDRFLGAAWKAMPADLSQPRLGKRVLDLLDDMSNWGAKKTVLGEADLFTITKQNEMYAHMNVNYLMLDKLPAYTDDWSPILDALQQGRFFVSTGEVLMPGLSINKVRPGDSLQLPANGIANIELNLHWTFPMNFIEIISGDGKKVYREKIDLKETKAFGEKKYTFSSKLAGRKWVRIEAWDVAANGAFSQTFFIL
ncbi:MAG: hypothetical protein P0Y53_09725 [Candidatus Pseudobacter hemicellulosilyticus]|uniref:Glycoside hydrolase family 57 N-terminal domain-containing protein n=1 Tax=Candidatus Pseudobacter hemicellulosilyticus TaxID=3121375 RepID=A0AAJ5WVX9_9BACT|nr:MAG: hypothetical protein P0Y53_09725 [Pseudobacter sp.]